jgi:RNA polymerase sigma factor (sigma-70 family)
MWPVRTIPLRLGELGALSRASMSDASTANLADLVLTSQSEGATECIDFDAALMQEAVRGSEEAFSTLVRKHQRSLVNFFARMGAQLDREDLAQETFLRLFRFRASYRPSAQFSTFLYHVARNVWADRGRKVLRFERTANAYEKESRFAQSSAKAQRGDSLDIEAALDRLSSKHREVIVLNIYQGLRYQEVADILRIPLGTVKSRINHALAALKEMLRED